MSDNEPIVVTIDGPAGSGKSTAAKLLAERLGGRVLDTGALYRAVALAALERGMEIQDGPAVANLVGRIRVDESWDGSQVKVFLDGRDVSEAIRQPEVSEAASKIAAHAEVRQALLALQRAQARQGGIVVAEGRDMGTVVFPGAQVKFFLVADDRVRAERRRKELEAKGIRMSLEEVLAEQRERDQRDAQRAVAPLRPARDAVVVDSTFMGPDEVVEKMVRIVLEAAGNFGPEGTELS